MDRKEKVLLIYTGGTIGMGRNPETGALEPFDFNHLTAQMPEFAAVQTDIDVYQFDPPIDSSDMTPEKWIEIVHVIADRYDHYDGFVILHGTDTMAFTASALSFLLENLTKPVILTGSQLPIGQLRTDGKENIVTSIEIAAAIMPTVRPSFRRCVSTSVADCYVAIVQQRLMPTASTLSIRSTITTWPMRASLSTITRHISASPTTRDR